MNDILLVESEGAVVRLTLNRPEKRNALSLELLTRLDEAIERIAADRDARVVVLAARGPVFCSGHDLGEMVGRSGEEYRALFALCTRVMLGLRRSAAARDRPGPGRRDGGRVPARGEL